ncbi:MAG: hypothetical protein PHY54_08425 [Methylococcales bacterium]|nr:hypothetical protein [Methylococcales bacterium]
MEKSNALHPMNTTDNTQTKSCAQPSQATHVAIVIIMVVVAMATTAILAKFGMIPYETLIFVSGTVGGAVNSFRRIQNLSMVKTEKPDVMTERLVIIQIYLSPFVGGVFAFVLYTIFMAGFVQGSLFPVFASGKEEYKTFSEFASMTIPATNADVAKAIVWAFIAGFSEGLVPNFINKITKDAGITIQPDASPGRDTIQN